MKIHLRPLLVGSAAVLAIASACNVFDPIDNPGGDRQLLSAARACFDKGDFACAREYYGKLGGNEDAIAELAFLNLDQEGMDIAAMVRALSISDGEGVGSILTELAEALSYRTTPGEAKRQRLVDIYKTVANIQNARLRGFVRFTTSIAIAGEILAEEPGIRDDNVFSKTDLISNVATCDVVTACGGGAGAECTTASAAIVAGGSTTRLNNAATASLSGAADWGMFVSAINALNLALTEMEVASGESLSLTSQILNEPAVASDNECARALLVQQLAVGRN